VTTPTETRYAKSGDVNVAYQVVGEGPLDLVLVPGWVSHVERVWEEPAYAAFLRRLASFSRLIILDRRGTGLSDRVSRLPTLEERMDDVRAVMDAAHSERAALFGISEGGPMCMLFAATYPQRTAALVLYGTFARNIWAPDYPWGHTPEVVAAWLERVEREWGTGITAQVFAPSVAQDEGFVQRWARFERNAVSPGGARALLQLALDCDVRDVLPSIRVPTLILHRSGDAMARVDGARYIAARIPGAKFVELSGVDHFAWLGDDEEILGEVQEYLTGVRHGPEPDRVLATLLFIDIAGSTERVRELGDARWRELLETHYVLVRRELARFRGQEIDTAGDGLFASFDGPARAIRCACAIRDAVASLGVEIRAGLHTGECTVIAGKLGGIAVHVGARVAAHAEPGEVLVSSTVKDLVVGSGLRFADRGAHSLKGLPGEWRLSVVER
jgi:pimeloyl-ACP methyl ester carboxylesterase